MMYKVHSKNQLLQVNFH